MTDFAAAAALGGFVALGELVSRDRDSPRRALLGSVTAWLYCLLNALGSVSALALMLAFDVNFGQKHAVLRWTRILAAGAETGRAGGHHQLPLPGRPAREACLSRTGDVGDVDEEARAGGRG